MRRFVRNALYLLILAALALPAALTLAQSGGGYDLSWNTVDGGGATFSTGGDYSLGGTAGQAEAGTLSNGAFMLSGGFWGGGLSTGPPAIYLPLVFRSHP